MKVEKGTAADLAYILDWLKVEFDEDGDEGFWFNRGVIRSSLEEGTLWVILEGGQAVAYQVGDYSPDIINVRKDKQRQGYGSALFKASLARAMRDGVNVLKVECYPSTSLQFCEKHGFERYDDPDQPGKIMLRRVLQRHYEIAGDLPEVTVTVSFYPEAAQYTEGVPAISIHRISGAKLSNGSIQLARRVVGLGGSHSQTGDLVVKIEIDTFQRCYCKAKHLDAREAGVVRDSHQGSVFYIDAILPLAH
jgi:GNAT superfamily N-acetyltransferase